MGPPHRETGNPSHRRAGGGGWGPLLPQEVGAGPLQSLIKPLAPQSWELGGAACPLILSCQGLGLLPGTRGHSDSCRESPGLLFLSPLYSPISRVLGFWHLQLRVAGSQR